MASRQISKSSGDVYFIRHGETDWNQDDKLRGWSDIPLNNNGIAEVKRAAQVLKNRHILNFVAADLKRVMQTVEILSKALKVPYQLDSRIRDFDYGDWTGVPVKRVLPKLITIFRDGRGTPPNGEEDYTELEARVNEFSNGILRHARGITQGNFGVVSNNRIARMIMSFITGDTKWELQPQDPLGNAGIMRFSLHGNLPGMGDGNGEFTDWGWEILDGESSGSFGYNEE